MTKKKKTTKKPPAKRLASAEATPQAVADTLIRMIGLSDHLTENDNRIFTFVITSEIFETLKNPKKVSTRLLDEDSFGLQLQEAFIPFSVKTQTSESAIIHEVLAVTDQSDNGIWIAVTLRINALLVRRVGAGETYEYYREYNHPLAAPSPAEAVAGDELWSFEYE